MWLRTLMVVAVSCLGIDPSAGTIGRLVAEGQEWCVAQVDRLDAIWGQSLEFWRLMPEQAELPSAMPNGLASFADESTMPNGLACFVQETPQETLPSADAFAAVMDRMVLEFANDREPELDPALPTDSTLAESGEAIDEGLASVVAAPTLLDPAPSGSTQTERVATAFRLTQQAIHAWVNIFQVTATVE